MILYLYLGPTVVVVCWEKDDVWALLPVRQLSGQVINLASRISNGWDLKAVQ